MLHSICFHIYYNFTYTCTHVIVHINMLYEFGLNAYNFLVHLIYISIIITLTDNGTIVRLYESCDYVVVLMSCMTQR